MNDIQILRVIENDMKGTLAQIQIAHALSNDAMCLLISDILGSYEKARATDYLLNEMAEAEKKKEEEDDADS